MTELRVVHYLNQFFAGLGGEEQAGVGPGCRDGAIGPGQLLARALGADGTVAGTVYCGDDYVHEHADEASAALLEMVARYQPDLLVAGPAFGAGRYGLACGRVAAAVHEQLGVAAVTGMHPENPGVPLYHAQVHIVPTGPNAASMGQDMPKLAALGLKLARGERVGPAAAEGYLPRGLRYTDEVEHPAAVRAVEMLLKRLRNEPFTTEWPLPEYDRVAPPAAIRDLSQAKLALVTSGGIVPRSNPDRIESSFATKWLRYSLAGVTALSSEGWQSVHGGYDTTNANADPNRVLPIDVVRELEREGVIGQLHEEYFVTVGSGASTTSARRFANEIAAELKAAEVDGVLFTAT